MRNSAGPAELPYIPRIQHAIVSAPVEAIQTIFVKCEENLLWKNLCVLCVLSEAGGLKTKTEPQRRKGRKGNYAFPIRGTDETGTMPDTLKNNAITCNE